MGPRGRLYSRQAVARLQLRQVRSDEGREAVTTPDAHAGLLAALNKILNNWGDLHPKDRQQARAAIAKATGGVK